MTKSTVTKIFIGSLIAIAGGVVLLAAGLFVAYVNGTFIMRGPDVVGMHPSAFTWSMAGLAIVGILAVVGGALAQFVAWIGAVLNTSRLDGQDLVHRPAGAGPLELRVHRDARVPGRGARRHPGVRNADAPAGSHRMTTTSGTVPANVVRVAAAGRAWATDLRLGGALLTIAGVTILMGIITAEALYPDAYTTGGNEISDLGGTRPPNSLIFQPSAMIFDLSMAAIGILVIAGSWFVHRVFGRRSVTIPMTVLGIGALGRRHLSRQHRRPACDLRDGHLRRRRRRRDQRGPCHHGAIPTDLVRPRGGVAPDPDLVHPLGRQQPDGRVRHRRDRALDRVPGDPLGDRLRGLPVGPCRRRPNGGPGMNAHQMRTGRARSH